MKTALLIAGHVRDINKTFLHLYNLKNKLEADVFISTFDETGINHHFWCGEMGQDTKMQTAEHMCLNLLAPVAVSFNEYVPDETYEYKFANKDLTNGQAVYSMFFKIWDAFQLIPNPADYDLIVRTRFDLIDYEHTLHLGVPESYCYVGHSDKPQYVSDAFFAACPADFAKIIKIIDWRESDKCYNAEHMLTDWLNIIDVKPVFGKFSVRLRDKVFN